jgi:hypothetical protein
MVLVLKKGASKEEIDLLRKKMSSNQRDGVDTRKFCGVLKLKEDPMVIQKKLRNEWGEGAGWASMNDF